ncbi:MAG: DNA modification methylase [Aestuariivirga sp.]
MKANISQNSLTNTSILSTLQLETLAVEELKFPHLMSKKIADKAVQSLMRAIARVGHQIVPILVDDENFIVAGFEVAAALMELGSSTVAVVKLGNLTKAETSAIMLLLAKVPERSPWDVEATSALLHEISIEDPDALEITGFEVGEIDVALNGLDGAYNETAAADMVDAEELSSQFGEGYLPVVQAGDVFVLGPHRVVCGDSLKAETYTMLLDGEVAAAVIADPPYNIQIAGNVSGLGKAKHSDFAMGVGEMSFEQFSEFLKSMLLLSVAVLSAGALLFVFMDRRHLEELFKAVRDASLRLVDVAIWNKLSGGMGGLYRSQHEPCIVAQVTGGPLINNVQLGKFGRYRTNVWDFRGYNSFGKGRMEAIKAHPTVKPWQMLAEIILDCTKRGAIVLDPFLGSGSTILAAETTARRCFGIELEPKYVEVAIARWEAMTRAKALHLKTGLTLEELRTERSRAAESKLIGPSEGDK